jgi:hypothetical protein
MRLPTTPTPIPNACWKREMGTMSWWNIDFHIAKFTQASACLSKWGIKEKNESPCFVVLRDEKLAKTVTYTAQDVQGYS